MKNIALTILAVILPALTLAQNIEQTISQSEELLHEFDQDIRLDTVPARVNVPNMIPMILPAEWFIPDSRLAGTSPWTGAPITRPVVYFFPQDGLSGLIGAGAFSQSHPDKFFSTLNGNNIIDIPQLFLSEQRFLGNTLRLGRKVYFVNGIL